MHTNRFSVLTTLLTARLTRRTALATGTAATLTGFGLRRVGAQESTPAASPAVAPVADAPGFGQEFLFVQTAEAGSWQPTPGKEGVYTLTLTGAAAQTVYFSDRPDRIVGAVPMQQFLDGLGFTPDNPPNAAVVTGTGDDEDVLVIELRNPAYEAEADTLTYEAVVLEGYAEEGLAFVAERQEDGELPDTFGTTSLFIDDCNDIVNCRSGALAVVVGPVPGGPISTCWSPQHIQCRPCYGDTLRYYGQLCNDTYPDCAGECFVSVE